MPHINPILRNKMPAIMDDGTQYYIQKIKNKTIVGFKYFDFVKDRTVSVKVKGSAKGEFIIKDGFDGNEIGRIAINSSKDWTIFNSNLIKVRGKQALFFEFKGRGKLDFLSFEIK